VAMSKLGICGFLAGSLLILTSVCPVARADSNKHLVKAPRRWIRTAARRTQAILYFL